LNFVLDATFSPQLATALQALSEEDAQYKYAPTLFGADAGDMEICQGAQKLGAFLVTLDTKMTKKPQERAAMKVAGIGVFVFTGRALAQKSFREIAATVLAATDEMLEKARETKCPFLWGISDRGKFTRLDEA
jgi:predicted nuclease of predicted toxin-antitoxin system